MINLDCGDDFKIEDFEKVVYQAEALEISNDCLKQVNESYLFLKKFSIGRVIYGVNSGFGPMASHIIPRSEMRNLQLNLIRSHACGAGKDLSSMQIRAVLIARLVSLSKGYSGIHPSVIELLCSLLNYDIAPRILAHGGVGASGDLVQLAHLALSLIGEGESWYKGKLRQTASIFEDCGLVKLEIRIREGLSLMNGTSAMTGIGLMNVVKAKRLLRWTLIMSAMLTEAIEAYDDHLSFGLNAVKKHKGQAQIAKTMREILSGSQCTRRRREHDRELEEGGYLDEKLQEFYSIRCIPQVLGPVLDTIKGSENILLAELNSVNDNPIVDCENGDVYQGGNFHGDYVSHEMDKLKAAITKLSMLCERQINFMMNHKINDKLSPFINLGRLGFNFGLQGMQFTATSTTAENQSLAFPMCVHSIPTNNDNQDIVSMGTNAALMTTQVIENSFEVLAIGLISAAQAVDYLGLSDRLANASKHCYDLVRNEIAKVDEDLPRYQEMKKLTEMIKKENLQDFDFFRTSGF